MIYTRFHKGIYSLFLVTYILSLPLTNAFRLNAWLPVPLLVMFLFLLIYAATALYSGHITNIFKFSTDIWIVGFLTAITISSLMDISSFGIKQINHLLSYFVVICVYYFGLKLLVWKSNCSIDVILKWVSVTVIYTSLFGVFFEFIGENILNINVGLFIPRISGTYYHPIFAGSVIRSRAFMSESSNFALMLNVLVPVTITYWFKTWKSMVAILLTLISITAFITTFSAAAFAGLAFGIMVALSVYIYSTFIKKNISARRIRILFISIASVFVLTSIIISNSGNKFVMGITSKLLLQNSSNVQSSAGNRMERWTKATTQIENDPLFGYGAGAFLLNNSVSKGIVSWWLQILIEGWLLSVIFIFCFYISIFIASLKLNNSRKYAYIISLSAAAVQYAVISDYWLPWIWFLFIMVQLDSSRRQSSLNIINRHK